LIDPAYKLEKLTEAYEKVYAFQEAWRLVDEQTKSQRMTMKTPVGRDVYE